MRIAELLQSSVEAGASDLHVPAGLPPLARVDGELKRLDVAPLSPTQAAQLVTEPMAAHEVMLATPAIHNLIREDQPAQMASAIQTSAARGMQTLEQSRRDLARRGLIAFEESAGPGGRRP